jgi:hypothetical protein
MILRGLKTRFCKSVAIAMAVALTLTLPSQGRCDDVPRGNLILVLVEIAKPKKPESKPVPACTSPCCPMGTCTGAATLPCCPMARCSVAPVCIPTQGTCSACPVAKPEACSRPCYEQPCCEQAANCCKVNQTLAEVRALCAEQAHMLRDMRGTMREMTNALREMQIEVQMLRQNQVTYPPSTVPEPVPDDGVLPVDMSKPSPQTFYVPYVPVGPVAPFSFILGYFH